MAENKKDVHSRPSTPADWKWQTPPPEEELPPIATPSGHAPAHRPPNAPPAPPVPLAEPVPPIPPAPTAPPIPPPAPRPPKVPPNQSAPNTPPNETAPNVPPPPPIPPPIIGPDGREIKRPTDANGRPLPIYVSPDGKPVLDNEGRAMPVRFDQEGKPIPLNGAPPPPPPQPVEKISRIPQSLIVIGVVDSLISLGIAAWSGYLLSEDHPSGSKTQTNAQIGTLSIAILGALSDFCPVLASTMNKKELLPMWIGSSVLLLLAQGGVTLAFSYPTSAIVGTCHCLIRCVIACLLPVIPTEADPEGTTRWRTGATDPYPTQRFGGGGGGSPSTVVVREPYPVPVATGMPMPYGYPPPMGYGGYGYGGYGYGGYPYGGYGYGGGVGEAALLGLAVGSMYGGGFGGFGGCYDYGACDYW